MTAIGGFQKGDLVRITGSQEPLGEVEKVQTTGYILVRIIEKKTSPKPRLVPFRPFELTKCNIEIQEEQR